MTNEEYTRRLPELRGTITALFQRHFPGRPYPTDEQMNAYLQWIKDGDATGDDIDKRLAAEPEAVAIAAALAQQPKTPRLHVEGLGFVDENGQPWTMAFLSGFRDYERFLAGEDIRPLLQETVDVGANGRRVFGMFDFGSPQTQRLYPDEHPDIYFDLLPAFAQLYASFGLYIEFTAFADTGRAMPTAARQLAHWLRLCDVLRTAPNVLLERVNEDDSHENHVDAALPKPDGICSSFGSNGAGANPPTAGWDYADLHSERPADLPKLLQSTTTLAFAVHGFTGFGGTQTATVASEPIGFADAGVPGRRVADTVVAYLLGLGCRWGAGGTAHSDCGVQSVLLSPTQRACVEAFLRGVRG
jgi:hypothetical protein